MPIFTVFTNESFSIFSCWCHNPMPCILLSHFDEFTWSPQCGTEVKILLNYYHCSWAHIEIIFHYRGTKEAKNAASGLHKRTILDPLLVWTYLISYNTTKYIWTHFLVSAVWTPGERAGKQLYDFLHVTVHSLFLAVFPLIQGENRPIR